jgi:hypothetical protein
MLRTLKCHCGNVMVQGSGYFQTDYLCSKCGKEYNSAGQRLTPRSQWGEETGEVFT